MSKTSRFEGCLLGLACGDAVGTTVEFRPRGSFQPVTDMTGGGPFRLRRGEWTDDTSMALCMATSLVERGRFDARDIMDRFCRWMDDGYLSSSNGTCFDIGGTVSDALERYKDTGNVYADAVNRHSAGNGCLMRLAPIPMFFHADARYRQVHATAGAATRGQRIGSRQTRIRRGQEMAETTDDPLELTGCKHCWPESAEAAWDARRSLRELAIWIDEPHFTMRGLRCAHCSGNFISVFMESIDWTNGDDAQTWMTVPVTADELARVEALLPSSIEVALRVVPSQRRSLHRDHPSGCDARIGWTTGIDISSHD